MKKYEYVLCVILVVISVLLLYSLTVPRIELVGNDIELDYKSDYIEPGYKAYTLWFDITNLVKVESNIDSNKVGTYEVKYKIDQLIDIVNIRKVNVKEKEPPIIKLKGDTNYYVCPNKEYEEPGYKAKDNYDGEITDKVEITRQDDKIIYEAYDSSNNYTKEMRNLIYEDKDAPVLTLKGGDITLKVGETYEEPGYEATDNCLGDIKDKVEVVSNLDNNKIGSYTITYKVSDGVHETKQVRNVYVVGGIAALGTQNTPGTIYLTFDDGPSETWTRIVLDTLKKYNVKATFFIVPKNTNLYYLIKEEYNDGHSLAIHSASHNYSYIYSSDERLYNDIDAVNNIIKGLTGNYAYLYRYPGGSSNTVSKNYSRGIISRSASILHQRGFHYFDWNVSSGDADGRNHSASDISNNVISRLSKDRMNVVLMHDTHDFTAYAVEEIIKYGISNGYTFAPITMNTKEIHHTIAN